MIRPLYALLCLVGILLNLSGFSQTENSLVAANDTTILSELIDSSLANGKDTVFKNLKEINSTSDDYLPFFVDSLLLFTSNRKSTQEGQTTEFTEKVYMSENKKGKWDEPKKDGYKWNSDNNSALVGVSTENYYFYRSYMGNNGELFAAKRKLDPKKPWKAQPLKKVKQICSEFDETSIANGNGDTVYFVSNRSGNYDIYSQAGSNPAQPVDSINTTFDETDVFITDDGQTMYFSSNRPGGYGDYDIYESIKMENSWSSPFLVYVPNVNSDTTDRDFRIYGDSTIFFASNRNGGMGGMDIYLMTIRTPIKPMLVPPVDTVKKVDSIIVVQAVKDSIIPPPPPIVEQVKAIPKEHDELIDKLKELGLFPFKGEVQLGAFRLITSVDNFKAKFACINIEKLRMDTLMYNGICIHKFIIDKLYTDIDEALNKQLEIINRHCLPELSFSDMPFIGLLDKNNNRFAIFWKKDEFLKKNIFYIFQNGKEIWNGKRF